MLGSRLDLTMLAAEVTASTITITANEAPVETSGIG